MVIAEYTRTAFFIFALLILGSIVHVSHRAISGVSQTSTSEPMLIPPQHLDKFTFGFEEVMADLLWLRSVQNFDYCGAYFLTGETIKLGEVSHKICGQGWVFQMLDAATRIVPRYRVIYTRGAVGLSVAVNDRAGADVLFDRGSEVFPNEWPIFYMSGYHKAIEMNDPERAAAAFERAATLGAPNWVPLLAARLYDLGGRAAIGMQVLAQYYSEKEFDEWPDRAKERWRELEKTLGKKVDPRSLPRQGTH